ncbi:MAG: aspartate aminotransferase family protein [Promethearchaeota archaeon]|nr:MAG: aspartate aminotransferase family protein [Candidatus Lokiarchaeota archaeon]
MVKWSMETEEQEEQEEQLSQRDIIRMYSKYVCKPKAEFFKNLGLGVVQDKRRGMYLYTLEGRRKNDPPLELINCRTSGGVFNLGHQNPQMIRALQEGIEMGLDIGDHHMISKQRALLARDLAELFPGNLSKTQYCVGGGEAVDLALKMARAFTHRTKIISAKRSYHGVTGLAMAAGNERFRTPYSGELPEFQKVPFGDTETIVKAIDEQTAAVILETIPATGGILIAPPGYLTAIRKRCDEVGALYIADEVQAGLGRTGEMWGIYGGIYPDELMIPDIIVLGKGMSAGIYPMATCSYRPELESIFEEDPFIHISTTGGSELGCYITRKMLKIISRPEFLENVRIRGKQLQEGLLHLQALRPDIITEIRGRGLMWAIEFNADRLGVGYTLYMIENGVFADYCGNNEKTIKLMPPLNVTEADITEIVRRLAIALDKIPKITSVAEDSP